MNILVVASPEYADLGHIQHILQATVDKDNDMVFIPGTVACNGDKVIRKWCADFNVQHEIYHPDTDTSIQIDTWPQVHDRKTYQSDMVIVFAAGTILVNNIARNAISHNKDLHVFQNPLKLTN